jgi:hypothetical protein
MANEVIHRLDIAQERWLLSNEESQLRKDLKARVLGLAAVERLRRSQASRLVWLREGDACNRVFHLKANGRRRKNFIACLKNGAGEYKWLHNEKEQLLLYHFQSILGTKEPRLCGLNWSTLNLPRLPDHHGLDAPFTEQEIKKAIDELPAEKALGRTASPVSSTGHAGGSSNQMSWRPCNLSTAWPQARCRSSMARC